MGAPARHPRRHGVARERHRPAEAGPAGPRPAEVGVLAGRGRLAQPAHRPGLPAGHLHHRLGGGRVRADRRANLARVPLGVDLATFCPGAGTRPGALRRRRADPAGALRAAVGGEEAAAVADHAGHAARGGHARPAGGGGRRPAAHPAGAPGGAGRAAGHLHRLPGRARRPGRAAGQRRRGHRARAGGDLRAGRARGAGLRDPGGGERGVGAARGGGRRGGQRAGRGPRGRGARPAGPAGTGPAGRGPGPGRAVRLGHRRARLPGRPPPAGTGRRRWEPRRREPGSRSSPEPRHRLRPRPRPGGGRHDEVRGPRRLDHGGHGRPGARRWLARLGRAAGRHAAPGRAAQPGHARARWPPTWSASSCRPRRPCARTWPAWWWASTTRSAATSTRSGPVRPSAGRWPGCGRRARRC